MLRKLFASDKSEITLTEVIPIAIYHCNISIVSRGKGKSAVGAAAYRSGEKITNEWDGMTHDYTRKCGVVHTEIMLPPFQVIYQTAEDGLGDTVKPRLIEAAADLDRVLVIDEAKRELTLSDERITSKRIGAAWYHALKKVKWQNPDTLPLCHFAISTPFCVNNSKKHLTKRFMTNRAVTFAYTGKIACLHTDLVNTAIRREIRKA